MVTGIESVSITLDRSQFYAQFRESFVKKGLHILSQLLLSLLLHSESAYVWSASRHDENDTAETSDYQLIWSDEFDEDGRPDPNHWIFENGFVRNEELQWYQEENATCKGGHLVIEGRRERVENPRYDPASGDWRRNRRAAAYTSSCLKTRGKFTWQYGVLEVRARMNAKPGMWPAIWTLGNSRKWPACGEVDLFEYYNGTVLANACWQDRSEKRAPTWDAVKKPLRHFRDEKWADEFHIWKMVWDRNRIELKLDDEVLNTVDLNEVNYPPRGPHPFRQPHYVLLNLAIGGTRGGDPAQTKFPSQFVVDYVRVYQRETRDSQTDIH